jgi:drug/metabolite transporter (DMT)-like permease
MGIVSPISAVVAALVPLVVGLALGEHLRTLQAIGIVAALIAIALISADGGVDARAATRTEVRSAVLCGVFFGLVYVFLGFARSQAGLWPLAAERGGAVIALGLVGVLTRAPLVFGGRSLWVSCLAGFFDLGAQALYLIARQAGTLSIAAVLTSLYPVSTFFLARVVLGERLRRLQIIGVLIALGAIALIVA